MSASEPDRYTGRARVIAALDLLNTSGNNVRRMTDIKVT
jgi:hypothetical protein